MPHFCHTSLTRNLLQSLLADVPQIGSRVTAQNYKVGGELRPCNGMLQWIAYFFRTTSFACRWFTASSFGQSLLHVATRFILLQHRQDYVTVDVYTILSTLLRLRPIQYDSKLSALASFLLSFCFSNFQSLNFAFPHLPGKVEYSLFCSSVTLLISLGQHLQTSDTNYSNGEHMP